MMLSDNIKAYRKANNMSQDELAQKMNISRQSVSLWENGQSQPTIDNIIALTKIFGVSSDELLGNSSGTKESKAPKEESLPSSSVGDSTDSGSGSKKPRRKGILAAAAALVLVLAVMLCVMKLRKDAAPSKSPANAVSPAIMQEQESTAQPQETPADAAVPVTAQPQETPADAAVPVTAQPQETPADAAVPVTAQPQETPTDAAAPVTAQPQESVPTDLFANCKEFAIEKGELNGDYCIYQQPSTLYGGYDNEYFSVSYWGDSDMVEFCLHCPLSETQSINFYLRMRGGYNGKYEYLTSRYYRSDGQSIRSASGYIDPSVFNNKYPLSCDSYDGSIDGQDEFMEESRVGLCDLISCLKQFAVVENMKCDFGFVNF